MKIKKKEVIMFLFWNLNRYYSCHTDGQRTERIPVPALVYYATHCASHHLNLHYEEQMSNNEAVFSDTFKNINKSDIHMQKQFKDEKNWSIVDKKNLAVSN